MKSNSCCLLIFYGRHVYGFLTELKIVCSTFVNVLKITTFAVLKN